MHDSLSENPPLTYAHGLDLEALILEAHLGDLQALGRPVQLHAACNELVQVDTAVLVRIDQHAQRPDVVGGDAHGVQEARQLSFGDGVLNILRDQSRQTPGRFLLPILYCERSYRDFAWAQGP